jgi:hypothetical protein
VEKDADYGDAVIRLRLDVLNVVDACSNTALELRYDAVCHLFGGKAVVLINDAEDWDVDIRKDIDGHGDNCRAPEDHDQQRHDVKGVRTPEG